MPGGAGRARSRSRWTAPAARAIEFFVSSGEAEAQQFQGEAQGAEQVGAALLFVNQGR